MDGLWIEKVRPLVLSITLTLAWAFLFSAPFPKKPDALLGSMVAASAVLMGFLATAKTIVVALTKSDIFLKLKEKNYDGIFLAYLKDAFSSGTVLLVWSIVGFFVCDENIDTPKIYSALLIFLAALSIATFHRVVSVLFKFLSHV